LVKDVSHAVQAIDRINTLDRNYISQYARSKFSKERMVEQYLEIYKKIISLKG
jgi:glycosyltransferase involved in cell wall biosynthesis